MYRMRCVLVFLFIAALVSFKGCGTSKPDAFQSTVRGEAIPWTASGFKNTPADFQFAIVSDRTGRARTGVFKKAMEKLNLLQPEFVMCVGDLIQGATEDRDILNQQYGEVDDMINSLEMRFFRVAGNHDISNSVMMNMYRKRYGIPYYHFVYNDVLFLIVCTEDDPETNISSAQIDYMQQTLENNKNVRWTFVFMHQPLFVERQGKLNEAWAEIENALSSRPHTVIAGHFHRYSRYEKHGQSYIQLATTGGGSKLRGREAGEFDHIVWVTMTDQGPRIANLMLDGIYDENVGVAQPTTRMP